MKYTFENIAGYDREKEALRGLCEIVKNRRKYLCRGARLPKGLVLYGEAGTGKTLFARVLASECGLRVLRVDPGAAKKEKDLCRMIKKAFASASRRDEPTMILFDELDKVLPNRDEEYFTDQAKMIQAQLLTLIDGMDGRGNFIFVATCNDYAELPETLIRPGRIDRKIHLGLPDYLSRVNILKMYMTGSACLFALPAEEIAKNCVGFSCAALETFVNECVLNCDAEGKIGISLIEGKLHEMRLDDLPEKSSEFKRRIDACLALGMFVVARSFDNGDYTLSLDSDTVNNVNLDTVIHDYDSDYAADYEEFDGEAEEASGEGERRGKKIYHTGRDCLHAICALFGGYAAEKLILQEVYDNVGRIFWTADAVLTGMSERGVLGPDFRYSESRNEDLKYPETRVLAINDRLDKLAEECLREAEAIVLANREIIEKFLPVLVVRERLNRATCEACLKEWGGLKKSGRGEALIGCLNGIRDITDVAKYAE